MLCVEQPERTWLTIREELLELPSKVCKGWPERMLYDSGWTVFGFYFFGRKIPDNCAACRETVKLLELVPGMVKRKIHMVSYTAPLGRPVRKYM